MIRTLLYSVLFFYKQKTTYEMRISDWSSDVCPSDLKNADGDGAIAFQIGGARLQRQHMRLLKPKLGCVLDGDDALAGIDHLGHGIEHCRLARAGPAGNDHVEPSCARALQHRGHLVRHGADRKSVV